VGKKITDLKLIYYIFVFYFCLSIPFGKEIKTKTIRTYQISRNFGTETRELTQSTFVRYNKKKVIDSTLYLHNIPLSEKFSYIDYNDRKSLKKLKGVERLLHFKYKYNTSGQLVFKALYGNNDTSLKWKEFYKYYTNGNLWKLIKFDPTKVNPENFVPNSDSTNNKMPWGESFLYNSDGVVQKHDEFYDGYILESTEYDLDSNGSIIIKSENFDPSIMNKTTFSYNGNDRLIEKIQSSSGFSIGSETYEYDKLGRKIKINYYSQNGVLEKSLSFIYNDTENRITKILTNASKKLLQRDEIKNNLNNKSVIEAVFDGKSRLIQKKNIGYDQNGRIYRIHNYDMLKPGESGKPILISIITYDYN